MLKNIALMGVATFFRLLSGSVLFVLIARVLGAESYGRLVYCFSVAMLLTVFVDYGHSTYLMREIGAAKDQVDSLMREAFNSKLILLVIYVLACLVCIVCRVIPAADTMLFVTLALSAICAVMGDFYNLAFRGLEQFQRETENVIIASLAHMAGVGGVILMTDSALAVAYGFVASRLLYGCLSYRAYRRIYGGMWKGVGSDWVRAAVRNMRVCCPYAVDTGLVGLRSYVDVFLINGIKGPAALGVYQVGMNLVKAAENVAPILANVYLPRLASVVHERNGFRVQCIRLMSLMLIAGGVLSAFFWAVPHQYLLQVFGVSYANAFPLFPLLGIFLMVRFIAVSQGVVVTALGLQKQRMLAGVLSLFILIASMTILLRWLDVAGAVLACVISALFLTIYFSVLAMKGGGRGTGAFVAFPACAVLFVTAVFIAVGKG